MITYTPEQLQAAYEAWQNAEPNKRDQLWHTYLDIRDGLQLGTSAAKAEAEYKKSNLYEYN